jgi:hypothetical protein
MDCYRRNEQLLQIELWLSQGNLSSEERHRLLAQQKVLYTELKKHHCLLM